MEEGRARGSHLLLLSALLLPLPNRGCSRPPRGTRPHRSNRSNGPPRGTRPHGSNRGHGPPRGARPHGGNRGHGPPRRTRPYWCNRSHGPPRGARAPREQQGRRAPKGNQALLAQQGRRAPKGNQAPPEQQGPRAPKGSQAPREQQVPRAPKGSQAPREQQVPRAPKGNQAPPEQQGPRAPKGSQALRGQRAPPGRSLLTVRPLITISKRGSLLGADPSLSPIHGSPGKHYPEQCQHPFPDGGQLFGFLQSVCHVKPAWIYPSHTQLGGHTALGRRSVLCHHSQWLQRGGVGPFHYPGAQPYHLLFKLFRRRRLQWGGESHPAAPAGGQLALGVSFLEKLGICMDFACF